MDVSGLAMRRSGSCRSVVGVQDGDGIVVPFEEALAVYDTVGLSASAGVEDVESGDPSS